MNSNLNEKLIINVFPFKLLKIINEAFKKDFFFVTSFACEWVIIATQFYNFTVTPIFIFSL